MKCCKTILCGILLFLSNFCIEAAFAEQKILPPSAGRVAENALAPIGIFTNALYSICYIVGAGFIMASVVRYKEHRENPLQTPISRPIGLLLFGLVLVAVPLVAKLSEASTAATGY